QLTFDAFGSLGHFARFPQHLIKPIDLLLDCVFPIQPLPKAYALPWLLSPYPLEGKCLGVYKGMTMAATDGSYHGFAGWQPFTTLEEQEPLWNLCKRLKVFEGLDKDGLELLCRQCVWAYVRRLYKELLEGSELPQAAFDLIQTDAMEVQRKDTDERQSWWSFKQALCIWQVDVNIQPSVLTTFEDDRRFMQWRCPWKLDEEMAASVGIPLELC
ncbi:hypothetical protein EBZ37_12010, partial [bacterium]|nr:hypothetical protein [bacterium]